MVVKKLLGLFFEEDTHAQEGRKGGYFGVFAVWGTILFLNGVTEHFFGYAIIDNWFVIVAIGLVAFLAAEVFQNRKGMGE